MITRGTNTDGLSNYELRSVIAAAALDVYEAAVLGLGDFEVNFAAQTLRRLTEALSARSPRWSAPNTQCAFIGAPACDDESCIFCYGDAPLKLDPTV